MNTSLNKIETIFSKQKIINFLFIIIVFIVTRQFPFSFLSPLMNIAVILMVCLALSQAKLSKQTILLVIGFLIIPLSFSFLYSFLLTDNKLTLIIRFYVVLLSVGLAYFVKVDRSTLKVFLKLCLLQVAVLFSIFIFLNLFFDNQSYLPVRFYFLEQGWGDVYTYGGFFYRVQIKGSALLVVAFILNIEMPLFKRKYLVAAFFLLGIIIAGNFAFLISLCVYFLYKIITLKKVKSINIYALRILVFTLLLLIAAPFIYDYAMSVIDMKKGTSLGTRGDQFYHLMANLAENPFTLFLGQGLGNTLDVQSTFRDYTGNTYFEVQILYIINQLGIVFFLLFLAYNFLIVLKKLNNSEIIIVYLIYISYAVTNPYMFDTNHVVVIVILNSWLFIIKNKNEFKESSSHNRSLQA